MRRFLITAALLLLAACGYAPHVDPKLVEVPTEVAAQSISRLDAMHRPGMVYHDTCCGSMKPLIQTGDWLVVIKTPFDDNLLGRVVVYKPKWSPTIPVSHRLVSGNAKEGFIASGDNNAHSEANERVTAEKYLGEVVVIYRAKKP